MDLHFFKWMPRDISGRSSNGLNLLVFLHGMGGTGQMWRPITAALEENFLCIAPDQRGHGLSRPVPIGEIQRFHASDYAEDITEMLRPLVQEYSPARLFIIGHSMGARSGLATSVAILNDPANASLKEIFKGFISVDIALHNKWGGGIGEPLAKFIRELPESFPDRTSLKNHLLLHCPDASIGQYLAAVAKKTDAATETWVFPFDHSALVQTIYQAEDAPIEDWVKTIVTSDIPMLALRGALSQVWLKEDYERSKTSLAHPNLFFEEWPDCGHGLPFQQRPKFVEKIREFVARFS